MGFAKGSTHPTCPLILPDGLRQINPTGKSLLIFRNRVKPRNQKYFPSRLTQISCISLTVSSHQRGDRASSRARGGMRWTQGRKARRQSQGGRNLVSGQRRARRSE